MKVPPNAEDRDDQDGRACGSDAPGASATPMAGVAGVGVWALALLALPVVFWLDHLLRQAGRPELVILGAIVGSARPPQWSRRQL